MNNYPKLFGKNILSTLALASLVMLTAVCSHAQATGGTFQWNGAVSTSWANAANWATGSGIATGPAPTNGTYNVRLNVTNGPSGQELVYDSSLGYTTYANTTNGSGNRGMVIGSVKPGTLRITGGTLSTLGSGPSADAVGNQNGTGTLIIDGGNYISGAPGLALGAGSGICNFTVTNGSATVTTMGYNLVSGSGFPAIGTINLNGGTLTVSNFAKQGTGGTNLLNFNGGVLKAATNNSTFLTNFLARASVRDKGAVIDTAGYNISISQPLLHSSNATDNAVDGGVTKLGSGTLTLTGTNNYTGPTIVKAGALSEPLPQNSASLAVSAGAAFVALTTNSPWSVAAVSLTNATLELNYRNWSINSYTNSVLNITNLVLSGTATINVSGTGFPVTNLTLLTYSSKSGGGSFALGTIPTGAAATFTDTGSAVLLNITTPSIQNLTWTDASADNTWQINGQANWNPVGSIYLEYPSGSGDVVTFDDTYSGGTVLIAGTVNPAGVNVNDTASFYTFSGSGQIGGATGIAKSGSSTLTILNSNSFAGVVNVTGGTLFVDNVNALGSTNGGTVVSGGGTVELGDAGATAITNESITISGAGVGGALGALRGTGAGPNVWAGPVIVGGQSARVGTENNASLTLSGAITDNGANYELIFRAGAGGTVTVSGTNSSYGSTRFYGDGAATGVLKLGANNALATNKFSMGLGYFDLNGFNQTLAGIADVSGPGTIYNNGGSASTLTINNNDTNSTLSMIADGASQVSLVKLGSGRQNLNVNCSYTGSTTVGGGELDVTLPMSSGTLSMVDGTTLGLTVSNSSWSPAAMNVTNVNLTFKFGSLSTIGAAALSAGSLNAGGSNVVNITATSLPIGTIPLIAYSSKNGAGTFNLGSLPTNVVATLSDTGSAIVLNVTAAPFALTWWGGSTATWNTNNTLDWNGGVSAYHEYTTGEVDFVVFDDTASSFSVSVANDVHPYSTVVNNSINAYTVGGAGQIAGTNGLTKSGTNILNLTSTNSYSGGTTINAGTLSFAIGALGSSGNINLIGSTISVLQWAPDNHQDISSRLRIGGNNSAANATAFATLDVGTNDVTFNSGVNQSDLGGVISNVVAKVGSGKLILAGGTTTFGSVMRINNGTLEVASGGTLSVNGAVAQANAALVSDNSSILVTGGSISVADRLSLATSGNSTSVVTVASGSLTSDVASTLSDRGLRLAGGSGTPSNTNTATVNLNGGTLTVARLFAGNGTNNTSIVNFNGGLLQPSDSPIGSNFISGLTHAYVNSGGAVINTGTNSLTINQALENDGVAVTDGGLLKLGSGQLTLNGTNTYTGATIVSNGVLWINGLNGTNSLRVATGATLGGTGVVSGPVTVQAGATLKPGTGLATNEMLTVNSSLSLAGTTVLQIGKSGTSPISGQVAGVTDISYGGTLIVTNGANATLSAGDVFTLFSTSGLKSGAFTNIQVLPSSLGLTATFSPASGQLTLATSAAPTLNFANSGTSLQFSWSGSYKLQVQTNSLSVGLGTNWTDYPGGSTSPVSVPINTVSGSVFFRLAQ